MTRPTAPLHPPLPREFYARPAAQVARDLLGMVLVRQVAGQLVSGRISETEAYQGEEDLACHARSGRTARTQVLYGPPGHAYIYFTYGMHWMLNVVAMPLDSPAAVLIRAIEPLEGLAIIAANRPGIAPRDWTSGPARLCRALAIDGTPNTSDLTQADDLWIARGTPVADGNVLQGPRVGINYAPEPWLSIPWRFRLKTMV